MIFKSRYINKITTRKRNWVLCFSITISVVFTFSSPNELRTFRCYHQLMIGLRVSSTKQCILTVFRLSGIIKRCILAISVVYCLYYQKKNFIASLFPLTICRCMVDLLFLNKNKNMIFSYKNILSLYKFKTCKQRLVI